MRIRCTINYKFLLIIWALYFCDIIVYRVLDDLKYKHYHSQMDRYLQLFHNRPVAAALYKKVLYLYCQCCATEFWNIGGTIVIQIIPQLLQLCKETDQDQLLNLYRQESDFLEAGCVYFTRSFSKRVCVFTM